MRGWVLLLLLGSWLLGTARAQPRDRVTIEIDLRDQLAYLIESGQVVLATPISSGRAGYETKRGAFRIMEKERNHFSTLYGKIVDMRGNTVLADADADMRVPPGGRFVPAPMRYFMRFNGAEGMHAGVLPGYPASHGCVRLPEANAIAIFNSIDVGTPVTVFGTTPRRSSPDDVYGLNRRPGLHRQVRRYPPLNERIFAPGPPAWWR